MDDISKYGDHKSHYRSPALASRTVETTEKTPKKEKKWSIGGFFRRKKKDAESESSSEEEQKKGFLQRRRARKEDKRKKKSSKSVGTFDHVLVAPVLYSANGNRIRDDENAIFSDPTSKGIVRSNLMSGSHEILIRSSRESLNRAKTERSQSRGSIADSGSLDGSKGKRTRSKSTTKERLKDESSSGDDCSQRSTGSSVTRFKSDDSLAKKENNSRRTRSARTERYMKRLTKEDEHVLNKEAELECKVDVVIENGVHLSEDKTRPSRRHLKLHTISNPLPQKIPGVSTVPPSHSVYRTVSNLSDNQTNPYFSSHKPLRHHEQPVTNDRNQPERSVSYDCNINRTATPVSEGEVMHVQFPIGKPIPKMRNPSLINSSSQSLHRTTPPPPPPRDPQRRYLTNYQHEPARPMSYAFETGSQQHRVPGRSCPPPTSLNKTNHNWNSNHRSNSEDHINQAFVPVPIRPASATPETSQQRYIRRHPSTEHYQYFAQNTPRSRKPIQFTPAQPDQMYLSDSSAVQSASDFWRQKDLEEMRRKSQEIFAKVKPDREIKKPGITRGSSPLIKMPPAPPARRYSRQSSGSSVECGWVQDSEDGEKLKRKSTNLEDALDELENIYKSLGLGDEDLLDRAERRDVPSVVTQKLLAKSFDETGSGMRGVQSDSGFNYESSYKKREARKIPDKKHDDMAYRRLCKEKPPPLDLNNVVSQVSYLLASPIMGDLSADENDNEYTNGKEPDITLDDVVYRNYKHTNNTLKIQDPQPPFGIPIGPISTASNSDYLHAVPDNRPRPRFIPLKSPDVVKDDLAYRSLRKDNSFNNDDCINNNDVLKTDRFKKKRAVRSMSANIFSLTHRDELDKTQSLTDVADTMDIARRILKDRQHKINSKIAVSDTETRYLKPLERSLSPTSTETLTGSNFVVDEPQEREFKQKLQVYIPLMDPKFNQKPPRCPTPDKKTKSVDQVSDKSNLEDLLSILAKEARETSEKLGEDLKMLEECSSKKSPNTNEETKVTSTLEKLSEIEAVSEHAKLCGKLLENTELLKPKVSELEEKCVLNEQVNDLPNEPSVYRSFANVIVTRNADLPTSPTLESDRDLRSSRESLNDETQKTLCGAGESGRVPCAVSELLTPPDQFCSPDDFNVLHRQNYLQVTRSESEHSSGFHTESQCSSGPDSLVEHVENSLFSDDDHLRSLNDVVQYTYVNYEPLNVIVECLEPRDDNDKSNSSKFNSKRLTNQESGSLPKDSKLYGGFINVNSQILCEEIENLNKDFQANSLEIAKVVAELTKLSTNQTVDSEKNNSNPELCNENSDSSSSKTNEQNLNDFNDLELLNASVSNYLNSVSEYQLSLTNESKNTERTDETNPEINTHKLSTSEEDPCNTNSESDNPTTKKTSDNDFFYKFEGCEDIIDSEVFWKAFSSSDNAEGPSTSRSSDNNPTDSQSDPDKCVNWYCNPAVIALACSYAVACIHQFASIDMVTFLGLILAIITVIASMIL